MEIVIVILWFGISGVCIFLGLQIDRLKSTVKKQQELIDELNCFIINRGKSQDKINMGMVEISENIAKKVVSIEEKVETIETKVSLIIVKNSITN